MFALFDESRFPFCRLTKGHLHSRPCVSRHCSACSRSEFGGPHLHLVSVQVQNLTVKEGHPRKYAIEHVVAEVDGYASIVTEGRFCS